MKLYDCRNAPNARRVRIFLAEKGINIPLVDVDIVKGENLLSEYRAKNPRGLVPLLELDDGSYIDETVAICRYFEFLQTTPLISRNWPKSPFLNSTSRHGNGPKEWPAVPV
jgi:glutathione S-transferase